MPNYIHIIVWNRNVWLSLFKLPLPVVQITMKSTHFINKENSWVHVEIVVHRVSRLSHGNITFNIKYNINTWRHFDIFCVKSSHITWEHWPDTCVNITRSAELWNRWTTCRLLCYDMSTEHVSILNTYFVTALVYVI